jgi:hypothetical protein
MTAGSVKFVTFCALICGLSTAAFSGCSAPVGPIGGSAFNHALMSRCCCFSSGTCTENDPAIVPPHANFHPLPTRPVFSPPAAIPGVYTPWPDPNSMPSNQATPMPAGTEVQSTVPNCNSPAMCSATCCHETDGPGVNPSNGNFCLRR